jgi:hypothetical protein
MSLISGSYVLLHSDGRFFPYLQNGLATMEIRLDGGRVSNASILDFRAANPVQHSFNCIAAVWVPAGSHTIQLVGYNHPSVPGGMFYVGSTTNLSVVVNPATNVTSTSMGTDSSYVNMTTSASSLRLRCPTYQSCPRRTTPRVLPW